MSILDTFKKSSCWIVGEDCPHASSISCMKDTTSHLCGGCYIFDAEKEYLYDYYDDTRGAVYLDDQEEGFLTSYLKILEKIIGSEEVLSEMQKQGISGLSESDLEELEKLRKILCG